MRKQFLMALLLCCSVLQAHQKVGVFCATDEKIPQEYKDCAFQLGESLVESDMQLITGGANSGLMAAVVNGFASKGNHDHLHGVIPELFKSYNVHHALIPEDNLTWTTSIYHRMQTFHDSCDAMVVLPGGFGTLHELMDFIVPKQWGLTNKKIILLNFDHYWDHQLLQFKTMVEKNVLQQKHLDLLTVVSSVDSCIEALKDIKGSDLHTLDERYWEENK